jgi:endoglucanase
MNTRNKSGFRLLRWLERIGTHSPRARVDRRRRGGQTRKRALALRFATIISLAAVLNAALASDRAQSPRTPFVSTTGWSTAGASILTPTGQSYIISGVTWYGFETSYYVPYGLNVSNYEPILDQIKDNQFNSLRIPFSNEVWETNPVPPAEFVSACPACRGLRARDILALIINYAGSIGLHVVLDNHRSVSGSSTAANGLWYDIGEGRGYTEQVWIRDWVDIQHWVQGQPSAIGPPDRVAVHDLASDGFPTVMGFDLRNEPHTPGGAAYLQGSTWGTGDGVDPHVNPNPNPFAPACVAASTCHDWRLAAERAGDTLLGDARRHGWPTPLIFVQGIGTYPQASGTPLAGPFEEYRWGGQLAGVNGNASNPGAPIVLNAGGTASQLGPSVANALVYGAHEYGPQLSPTDWFTSSTCYTLGCAPKGSAGGLVNLWCQHWAYIALPPGRYGACTGGVKPSFAKAFPWQNTGSIPYTQAPVWIGEFGTGNDPYDLASNMPGSQGQWFTDLINFIQSSYDRTARNDPGIPVAPLNWTYWAINSDDIYALLGDQYTELANPAKQYSFLCYILRSPPHGSHLPRPCGATGALPPPH